MLNQLTELKRRDILIAGAAAGLPSVSSRCRAFSPASASAAAGSDHTSRQAPVPRVACAATRLRPKAKPKLPYSSRSTKSAPK